MPCSSIVFAVLHAWDKEREEEKIRKEKILREIRRKFSGEMRG